MLLKNKNKKKEETLNFRSVSVVRIDTLVIEITLVFTSTTHTSSFTNARLCCFDASMNHESDGEMKDGSKEKREREREKERAGEGGRKGERKGESGDGG